MAKKAAKATGNLSVETIKHDDARRRNIPTAEMQSVVETDQQGPVRVEYARRNRDLDPQLVWRGKDEQDWSDLVVHAPPLYIQEKVHPKFLIDDLLKQTRLEKEGNQPQRQLDLFSDFNGIPKGADKTEYYRHDQNWSNRMILGDSLQVMASLAEREGLRGQVQCIYFDPPYGIKFNSNFQWSTTSRDVKDGKLDHITREPEQVKAFRDTWRDGIHSYLTYLRDRLTVARDLLTDSGSIFVQIGDENVHRVRAVMDEVFGSENFCSLIGVEKTTGQTDALLATVYDYVVWFAKKKERAKFRQLHNEKPAISNPHERYVCVETPSGEIIDLTVAQKLGVEPLPNGKILKLQDMTSQTGSDISRQPRTFAGKVFRPSGSRGWSISESGHATVTKAGYLHYFGNTLYWKRYRDKQTYTPIGNYWDEFKSGFGEDKLYVVQTREGIAARCVLLTTDPGDLVLDPTCGSGTTATISEQWGRRWITIDTSRVALALARARVMGARYPYYLLADSVDGQNKEAEVTHSAPSTQPVHCNIRHGFVYERVPRVTLKSIANNAEIDVIWDKWQAKLEPLREKLNTALKKTWQEWEFPREAEDKWSDAAKKLHAEWRQARIERQKEIDKSIAAKAEFEYLYDKPYEDKKKVRVAGPFTVESLSPHRVLTVDENDDLIDDAAAAAKKSHEEADFAQMVLDHLLTSGVQQAHKEDRIKFTSVAPWPGRFIAAEGRYTEGDAEEAPEKRAAIFIGPEFGTVARADLVAAAREAGDAGFDVVIGCAFNFDAHSSEFDKLGRIPVLKARMNADLHMAGELKNTGSGNLFVIFGEPDIDLIDAGDGQLQLKINGVDVFKPQTGEVISDNSDGIACWFIDTDYNEESFFVRHAYFLGASDPYKSLKTSLKAEINAEAWESLNSDTSRPFPKPMSGRIAVKVINHLGDEVMKVFRV